jgi:AhpD family alkylhydroperoxidase
MPRLTPIDPATATGEAKELLDGIQAAFGMTPNSFRAMANNPAVLKGWIELSGSLGATLTRKLGEQIAIAIAEQNGCAYCLSAHTAVAGLLGIDVHESTTTARASPTTSGPPPP